MPNYCVDIRIDMMPGGGEDIEYSFRFGKCDDFKKALATVKRIPFEERDYHPEDDHCWTVRASEGNLAILCQAFDNFADTYAAMKYQLPLPFPWEKQGVEA